MRTLVITPTLGESPWLAETVASVASHALTGQHVLVAPVDVVPALAARFPKVTVLPETGGGMYAAINVALQVTQDWDAFTYINDDDLLLPGFKAVAAALAARPGEPLIAYGRVRLIDGRGDRLGAIPVSPCPSYNRELYAQRLEPVYQHGTLVGRAVWTQHGGFDPDFRYCGDSEFFARMCAHGVPAVHVGGEVAAFRLHQGQLTKNRPVMIAERTRVDEKLGLRTALTARHLWARLLFRLANLPVYAGRILRHGFVSFDELLARKG